MRLSDFISNNLEAILTEWESFAATLLPAAGDMTSLALRDHAPQILGAIAKDITTAQTRDEQAEKSKGRAPRVADAPETAAQTHGEAGSTSCRSLPNTAPYGPTLCGSGWIPIPWLRGTRKK